MLKISLFLITCMAAQQVYCQWTTSGNNIYNSNTGNVGIGITNPTAALDVNGYIHGRSTMIVDMTSAGIAGWFRGPSTGSGNVVLQSNAGTGVAWWLTGTDLFKIGSGGVEPTVGTINVTSDGKVGINTTTPLNMFEIATTALNDGLKIGYNNNSGCVRMIPNNLTTGAYNTMSQSGDAGIFFGTTGAVPNFGFVIAPWSPNNGGIRMTSAGNVLIGKATQSNSSYVLDVNGNARANEVVVNTTGADFVFEPGYHLPSLKTIEKYIDENHHLPDIAAAAEMQAQGVDLGENQTRLLQKVEELTLYVIEQNKQIEALKRENQRLEKQNSTLHTLEQRIERLERSAGR